MTGNMAKLKVAVVFIFTFIHFLILTQAMDYEEVSNNRTKRHAVIGVRNSELQNLPISCPSLQRYRLPDGNCNNPTSPSWGSAGSALRRIVDNYYDDGVKRPRIRGADDKPLPSAREVSNKVVELEVKESADTIYTNLFQVYGQFLDHDIDFTPTVKDTNGDKFKCCTDKLNMEGGQHPDVDDGEPCFPIVIPFNDPFFKPRRCLNFVRSVEVEDHRLKWQSRLLKVSNYDMLPEDKTIQCQKRDKDDYCFKAGDPRSNEHPGLSAFHVIFLRMHNRIALQLYNLYNLNHWNKDERLFQETRKIVEAILQHISYNEWLPLVVGPKATRKYRLKSDIRTEYKYDSKVDPNIINAFSTAAFRYGHSTIPNEWTYKGEPGKIPLVQMFHSPFYIYKDGGRGLDGIIEGMLIDSSQATDHIFSDGVRNKLFETLKVPGMDLAAINIQRGRDHGLAPYNEYRKYCGLDPIVFDKSTPQVKALASVYSNADDVDLYIGGVTEHPVTGGHVGPTFACIIAEQFRNIKYGDRFWFENIKHRYPYSFSSETFTVGQVNAIRRMSMARILCDTTHIRYVPKNAFLHPENGGSARKVSCRDYYSIPPLDIRQWYQPSPMFG
ncbi:myeloperoxidase [Patella vulgata]|uniref:myeloperoxidase n=1 Tax=Patella vulgata TaxID=6465 RepID=UPI0024A8FB79|nr:myeloperoxidase [Patella vulgata]